MYMLSINSKSIKYNNMKLIIRIFLFALFFAGAISSTLMSGSNQKTNDVNLGEIYKMNRALAEDEPDIPDLPEDYEEVSCGDQTVTLQDGTTEIVHVVSCSGLGNVECECQCS